MSVGTDFGSDVRGLPSNVTSNFLTSRHTWAENEKIRSWSELQPFVAEYGEVQHWQEVDPRAIVGCYHPSYANTMFRDALENRAFDQLRKWVHENPSFLWDTGWELRNHSLIGNWYAYDVDGDLFIDGDGTKRSILARFVAEENVCPPLLVPNYKKAHIDWDAFYAYERISSLLGVGSVSWYHKPRHVWFEAAYLSQGKVYDIVELADWLERREATTGWRKYMFSVTNRLESKT